MAFSPSSATQITDSSVGASTATRRAGSRPSRARTSRMRRAASSRPTGATSRTSAPARRAATAWLRPLPPTSIGTSAGEQRLARPGQAPDAVRDVDDGVTDDEDAHPTLRTSEPRHDRAASPRCPRPASCPRTRSVPTLLGRWPVPAPISADGERAAAPPDRRDNRWPLMPPGRGAGAPAAWYHGWSHAGQHANLARGERVVVR